jgi:hypothetical protein
MIDENSVQLSADIHAAPLGVTADDDRRVGPVRHQILERHKPGVVLSIRHADDAEVIFDACALLSAIIQGQGRVVARVFRPVRRLNDEILERVRPVSTHEDA